MRTKRRKIGLVTAIVGVGLLAGISVPASSQTPSCPATDSFQAVALQPGESMRISVVNPSSGHGEVRINNVYGIIVRDEDGKILQETEVSPPPGGTAFSTFAFPPNMSDGNEIIPPIPNVESFSVEVSLKDSMGPCTTPIAALQGFDEEGATSLFANLAPVNLSSRNSSQTHPCAATDTFQTMALRPGESMRISVVNPSSGHGELRVNNVYGIIVRDENGKILQEAEVSPPPAGSAFSTFTFPPNMSDGNEIVPPLPVSVEVSLEKSTGPCTTPIAALQGFDEEGATSFFAVQVPVN